MSRPQPQTLAKPNPPQPADTPTIGPAKRRKRKVAQGGRNANNYVFPNGLKANKVWAALVKIAKSSGVPAAMHHLVGLATDQQSIHFDRLKRAGATGYGPSPELVGIAHDVAGLPLFREFIRAALAKAAKVEDTEEQTKMDDVPTMPDSGIVAELSELEGQTMPTTEDVLARKQASRGACAGG